MFRHRSRVGAAVLLGVVGATALVGCSSDDEVEQEHTAEACTALSNLDSVLTTASSELAEAQTVGDLRNIRESVQSAYDEADAAVEKVAEDRTDSLRKAWDDFRDEVASVDDEAAVTDARDSLVEEARALADARQSAQSELACG